MVYFLHIYHKNQLNVCEPTSPIDPMGVWIANALCFVWLSFFYKQVPPASRTRIIRYLEKQVYKDRPWEGAILSFDQTDLKAIQGDVFFFLQIAQKC